MAKKKKLTDEMIDELHSYYADYCKDDLISLVLDLLTDKEKILLYKDITGE